jgi:hypothetical protein
MSVLEDIQKLIKVDVKIVSDHPYPWHSGSRKQHRRIYKTKKIQTEWRTHKSESQTPQSKIKNAGTNRFLKLTKYLSYKIGRYFFIK